MPIKTNKIGARTQNAQENLGYANIDHDRERRKGFPEVVFGQGKSDTQILGITEKILARSNRILITRVSEETFTFLQSHFSFLKYDREARVVFYAGKAKQKKLVKKKLVPTKSAVRKHILIVCAGTGDIPVAAEARVTAMLLGCKVKTINDVGVAGIHRLLARLPDLKRASVIIAVAGMEGALPSVIAGLIDKPVIGLPTSIGYGLSMEGITAFLAMLNSCASGLTVVNIDNGFGAGFAAAQMIKLIP